MFVRCQSVLIMWTFAMEVDIGICQGFILDCTCTCHFKYSSVIHLLLLVTTVGGYCNIFTL